MKKFPEASHRTQIENGLMEQNTLFSNTEFTKGHGQTEIPQKHGLFSKLHSSTPDKPSKGNNLSKIDVGSRNRISQNTNMKPMPSHQNLQHPTNIQKLVC